MSETYPYPKRLSEVSPGEELFEDIEPIELTEGEKSALREWESPFFKEVEKLKELSIRGHEVFHRAFLEEKGGRLFSILYLDNKFVGRVKRLAEEYEISFENEEDQEKEREFSDALFEDLIEIAEDEERFEEYKEKGANFKNLQEYLGEDDPVVFVGSIARAHEDGEVNEEERLRLIERVFREADIRDMPRQLRKRVEGYTRDWARDDFLERFKNNRGDLSRIENPERMGRVVSIQEVFDKVGGLRKLKERLKEERRGLGDERLDDAKRLVLNIYQRYVNVLLAQDYYVGRLLHQSYLNRLGRRRAMRMIRGVSFDVSEDRLTSEKAPRTVERIDHFIKGVGLEMAPDGLYVSMPEKLADYAQKRADEGPPGETGAYNKYNAQEIKAIQLKILADRLLEAYGMDEGKRPWTSVIDPSRKGLAVVYEVEGKIIREIKIPSEFGKKGVVDKLAVLAHEIEGHVLRYYNRDIQAFDISLLDKYSSDGSFVLSEVAAMGVEAETKKEMVGVSRVAKPYYYLALLEKSRGGTFKECFKFVMEQVAKDEDTSLEVLFDDSAEFKRLARITFGRVLRIFRGHTPLDDDSGYLPKTAQLKYIEQELVVGALREAGIGELLYIAGVDFYSARDLIALGMLDLSKIEKPKMVVAREIWPEIKEGLDRGEELDAILEDI